MLGGRRLLAGSGGPGPGARGLALRAPLMPRGSRYGSYWSPPPAAWSGSANTHTAPPCGTSLDQPNCSAMRLCMRWASTPQPDCTATYCTPSTSKVVGTPVTPEFVLNSQRTSPVSASNARNILSLVPPMKTRPPAVVRTGPQFADSNVAVHTS